MSFSSASSELLDSSTINKYSRCSSVSCVSSTSSVIPMIAFIGVRISWLMFARNRPLDLFADSAASAAFRNASSCIFRCVMSRMKTAKPVPPLSSGMGCVKSSAANSSPFFRVIGVSRRSAEHRAHLALGRVAQQIAPQPLAGTGRHEHVGHLLADHLVAFVTEGCFGRGIELDDPAILVDEDDAIHRRFENRADARFAFAHGDLGALARGDVPEQPLDADHLALAVENGRLHDLDVHLAALGAGMAFDVFERRFRFHHLPVVLDVLLGQFLGKQIAIGPAADLIQRFAHQRTERRAGVDEPAFDVLADDVQRQALDQRHVLRPGILQSAFRAFPLGDLRLQVLADLPEGGSRLSRLAFKRHLGVGQNRFGPGQPVGHDTEFIAGGRQFVPQQRKCLGQADNHPNPGQRSSAVEQHVQGVYRNPFLGTQKKGCRGEQRANACEDKRPARGPPQRHRQDRSRIQGGTSQSGMSQEVDPERRGGECQTDQQGRVKFDHGDRSSDGILGSGRTGHFETGVGPVPSF
jgi:hypothetical protein